MLSKGMPDLLSLSRCARRKCIS